jgi:hypothetical protein
MPALGKFRNLLVYQHAIFDDSELAYLMDLHDAVERLKVKRDLAFANGDDAKVAHYEALRNEHITSLQVLLKALRK